MSPFTRRRFLKGTAGGAAAAAAAPLLGRPPEAFAAVQCPHPVPVVHENNCVAALPGDSGTWPFQLTGHNSAVSGFATRTSVDVGEPIELRLVSFQSGVTSVRLEVYRLGHYGGRGGRLVAPASTVNGLGAADLTQDWFEPAERIFGLRRAVVDDWTAATIPAQSVTGVYLVKVKSTSGTDLHHIPFVVRNDGRARDMLVVMPTNNWQAYNNWTGKSFYNYNSNGPSVGPPGNDSFHGPVTVAGSRGGRSRAVKSSFDRPWANVGADYNWVLRTEFPLIFWLERMGYDVQYTDDVALHFASQSQLSPPTTKTLVIAGHSEYWTKGMRDNVEAARNAGTNVASFSANTAYWQVRYENAAGTAAATSQADARTIVCFKTVEGRNDEPDAATGGTFGVNDYGPGNQSQGAATSALGADRIARTTGDHPEFATTTFRDTGAPAGDSTAPDDDQRGHGRVGPNRPENGLFGVMFVGDDDTGAYPLHVPAGGGNGGEFRDHPLWRRCNIPADGNVGQKIVGWEWDAVPSATTGPYAAYKSSQPAGVKRLSETTPTGSGPIGYLQDHGRIYRRNPNHDPPGDQPPHVHAVTYEHPSGALVFASGTMQWSWGLGPHFREVGDSATYLDPPADLSTQAIQQATYNLFVDGGIKPHTPEGVTADPEPPPPPPPPAPEQPMPQQPAQQPQQPAQQPQPPAPPRDLKAPRVRLTPARVRLTRDGKARIRITAPSDEGGPISGRLELNTVNAVRKSLRLRPRKLYLGSKPYRIPPGRTVTLEFRLSAANRRLLARLGRLRLNAKGTARDAAGNVGTVITRLDILPPPPTRRRR